jgi:uncharacterized integral membrane protein
MSFIRMLLLLICVALFVMLALANRTLVTVSFFPLPYVATSPLFLWFILFFFVGALSASLLMSPRIWRLKHHIKKLKKSTTSQRDHEAL